jgi:4'-phosphopantetheinyl transferase
VPSPPVEVWTIALTDPIPNLLSPDEQTRAARFRFDGDRLRWTRARSALRQILAPATAQDPKILEFTIGEHGKPALTNHPEIHFNLSHAGDYAMVAITALAPVGIDVERMNRGVDMLPLLRRLNETDLPPSHAELCQRWTDREARSKAFGGPLFTEPRPDVRAFLLTPPDGYKASLAIQSHADIMIIQHIFDSDTPGPEGILK